MQQEIMDLVGEYQLFEGDVALSERLDQLHRLVEIHIAVVVSVDEQDRRSPGIHGRDRGGFAGDAYRLGRSGGTEVEAAEHRPVVNTMDIDTGGEQVRI